MTKEEIKKYVEEDFQYHKDEFGLEREDAMDTVIINLIYRYEINKLSREDLLQCGEYLGFTLDMAVIDEQIAKRKALKEKRKLQRKNKKQ